MLANFEHRSILKSSLWNCDSAAMTADIQKERPQNLFLAGASPHQWPFVSLVTSRIVGAGNEELRLVHFYHLVAERIGPFGKVGPALWKSRAADAVPAGQEYEIKWLDFESVIEVQPNISHCREGYADAATKIV
jgi:hypothetical protein